MKNEEKKTAADVCKERLGDIGALLDQIGQELQERFGNVEDSGAGWSDAGDLGRTREQLLEALEGLSLLSRSDIEATLDEIRG